MSIRLTLICHAATEATRRADFPADEPIEASGPEDAMALAPYLGRVDTAWSSPALRAQQTAAALGLSTQPDQALADLDIGRWAGMSTAAILAADPLGFEHWLQDPTVAPHGGESIVRLLKRVKGWLDLASPDGARLIAVTHASFIRAAVITTLEAKPTSFWRIDVAPLCVARFHGRPGRWTLSTCGNRPAQRDYD